MEDSPANIQLYLAAVNGNYEMAQRALESGASTAWSYSGVSRSPHADHTKVTLEADTALHWAVESRNELLVRLLLQHKANPNRYRVRTTQENYGRNKATTENVLDIALRMAIKDQDQTGRIVQLLVEHNGDVRAISNSKRDRTRNMTWRAYLQLDFYALNHINFVTQSAISSLDLSRCQITDLSTFLTDAVLDRLATHVTTLNLAHNRISELPAAISRLHSLTKLDVSRNLLDDLPPSIALLRRLELLDISNNPLQEIPDHVIQGGVSDILGYYSDILEGVTEVCLEMKLLIVGEENVGKTALFNHILRKTRFRSSSSATPSLTRDSPNTVSTHGIDTITFTLKGTMESQKFHSSSRRHSLANAALVRRRTSMTLMGSPLHNSHYSEELPPQFVAAERSESDSYISRSEPSIFNHQLRTRTVQNPKPEKVDTGVRRHSSLVSSTTSTRRHPSTADRELYFANASDKKIEGFIGVHLDVLFQRLKDEKLGIKLRPVRKHMKLYKKAFQGNDFVEWISQRTCVTVSDLAAKIGTIFLQRNFIKPISRSGKDVFQFNTFYRICDCEKLSVEYQFHGYDFAGQEIYYPTHQFFLSPKAIYIVVFDLRKELADTRLEYWLQSIQGRAGDSCAVVLVGTHMDDERFDDRDDLREKLLCVEEQFRSRFPTIKNIYAVSNKTGEAVECVRERLVTLAQELLSQLPPVPVKYRHLENMLLQEREKRRNLPIMDWDSVLALGEHLDMKERTLERAVQFLHNRGIIVFFPALNPADKERQIITLDPQWLTKCMGNLIGSGLQQSFVRNGVMRRENLHHVWRHPMFPPSTHEYLLRVLGDIDVVFLLPKSPLILISCLLPDDPPELGGWFLDDEVELVRVYHLKFFPSGFFSRLIIRMLLLRSPKDTARLQYWKTGFCVSYRDGASLLVEQFIHQRDLVIRVRGCHNPALVESCRDIFKSVIELVELLIRYWFHLQSKRYIPCPHCVSQARKTQREKFTNAMLASSNDIHYFSLSECISSAASCFPTLRCPRTSSEDGVMRINLSILAPDILLDSVRTNAIEAELIENREVLGVGGFGTVYKANFEGRAVAIKELTEVKSEAAYKEFIREVLIMTDLYHDNLVNLLGYTKEPLSIVMEYEGGGNLYDFIHSDKPMSLRLRLRIASDMAHGLQFLHSLMPAVIHRDLKSPNVLLHSLCEDGSQPVAKIADFGLSIKKWAQLQEANAKRDVPNPFWLAPEILEEAPYGESVDIHALGVIMWELVSREHPYEEFKFQFQYEVDEAIRKGQRPTIPTPLEGPTAQIEEEYGQLIARCWAAVPKDRPSAQEVGTTLMRLIESLPSSSE